MPAEIHEHFDNNDQRTGYTVVTRESPWDEESRGRALALSAYARSLCGCGCGLPRADAYDETKPFLVDTFVCSAGRALAKVQREDAEKAEKSKRPDGWRDGLHYYVVPHEPETPTSTD